MTMTKTDLITVLAAAREAILAGGERDFRELKRRDKQQVFDIIVDGIGEDNFSIDGDGDGCYAQVYLDKVLRNDDFEDVSINFSSHSESMFLDDQRDSLVSFSIEFGDLDDMSDDIAAIDALIERLQEPPVFINLTPHAFTLYNSDKSEVLMTLPGAPEMARVSQSYVEIPSVGGYPVFRSEYGAVTGLPDPQPNTYYIVSLVVAQRLDADGIHRTDILVPDTGAGAVRNESGGIVGTTRFMTV